MAETENVVNREMEGNGEMAGVQDAAPPQKQNGPGRGWHGNPEGHAAAGRKGGKVSGGNFANNRQRASEAGRKGGQVSGGNFANDREKAREAGRKGGQR